ncbi:hypothetical protein ACE1AT_00295 [Pelatocladus sp. BLCC-F211]|uniref:hypothetical protein n=1 Tax=Pelatocladus sp. BLCC-F211 TaxID=3342752 RepID=UPI0035B83681
MKPRRNPRQRFLKFIIRLLRWIWRIFYTIGREIITKLRQFISYLGQRTLSIFVLILLIFFSSVILAGILPSPQIFEGNLVVKNLSFTYAGQESNKLFLNNIREISQIEGEGNQTFILNGRFSNPSDQILNQKLLQLNSLKILLPHEKSQWIISPATTKQPSELKISELRLQPKTSINSLSYNPYNRRLSLPLTTTEQNDVKVKTDELNEAAQLSISLGDYPIKLTLTGYKLEDLGLQDSPDSPNPIELIFQPDNSQLSLSLNKTTRLSVNLPDLRKVNSEEWLWGDLDVKNVNFEQLKQTGININDEIYNSTIIKGQIRMGERELKIESNQFLLISKPGINRLLNLEIIPPKPPQEINVQIADEAVEVSTPPEGLEVRFAGEAKQIQVGLDRRLPVRSLKSSFLANFFSNDVIIAMISFFSAAIISLLSWIVNDFLSWLSANSKAAANP